MSVRLARTAFFSAAALIAWFAVRRDVPPAPRPAELFDESRAVSSWTRPDTLGRGETLDVLFRRGGLEPGALLQVLNAAPTLDPRRVRAGTAVEFVSDSDSAPPREILLKLDMTSPASSRVLRITRVDSGGWVAVEERLAWARDTVVVRGEIRASMYDALSQVADAVFPGRARDELVENVASVFDHRVDWSSDMRTGDSVHVLVERARSPEGDITRPGRVLAARLFVRGRPIEAFCFPDDASPDRCPKYYDSTGKSLATAFLRAPLQFRWISSRFGNRFHPVLRTWRAHQGIDYAANAGTPVRAVGDGTVRRATYAGGYGNVVDIVHPNGWVTRYAHLSRFSPASRAGSRVMQGDVIGYVGSTGLATGPHLHFEVLVQGTHRNPAEAFARVDGTPLADSDRPRFARTRDILLAMLDGSPGGLRGVETP